MGRIVFNTNCLVDIGVGNNGDEDFQTGDEDFYVGFEGWPEWVSFSFKITIYIS